MKKIYSLLFFGLIVFRTFSQTYTITTGLPNNIISGSGTTISGLGDDNWVGPFNIGFNFPFFNTNQTQFYMAANGSINFSSGDGSIVGTIPSTSTPNNFIAFASTDQHPGASSSPIINYFISGTSPNRVLVINYQNIRHYSNSGLITSVQLQLFEGSGKIEIHNIQNNSGGFSRTIGIENSAGSAGFSPSGMNNSSSISLSNQMIRFSTCTPPPAPTISPSTAPTICSSSPSATLTATCSVGTLNWSTGATTSAITVSPTQTTTYTATCLDNSCQTSSTITVPVLQTPSISPSGTNYICTGNSITLTASSTTSGVSFQWYKDGSTVQNATNATLNVNSAGSYSVIVTKDGCSANSASTIINENSTIPNAPTISPVASFTCPGGSLQLTANNCSGIVNWSNGQTGSVITFTPQQDFSTLTATCKVDGCFSANSNTFANAIARVSISAPNTTTCPGGSITISSTLTVSSTVSYQWLLNGNPISQAINSSYSATTAGNYSIRVTYQNGCIITSSPISISVTNSIQPVIYACGPNLSSPMSKIWDNGAELYVNTAIKNSDKSFYVGGSVNKGFGSTFNTQGKLNKLDSLGNTLFSTEYGSTGGDTFESIVQISETNDGNYLLGMTTRFGGYNYTSYLSVYEIRKVSPTGNQLLQKTFSGNPVNGYNYNNLSSVINTNDGFLIGGSSSSNSGNGKSENSKGDNDYWIIKTDDNLEKVWDKTIGGIGHDFFSMVIKTDDGYFLAGTSSSGIGGDKTSPNYGSSDYWLVKIDLSGNKLWDKSFGGSDYDALGTIKINTDGTIILVGSSNSGVSGNKTVDSRGQNDVWVVKVDNNGNKLWDKRFGGSLDDSPRNFEILDDGGLLISGQTFSPQGGDRTTPLKGSSYNYVDFWVIRTDVNGNKIWDKNYGSSQSDFLSTSLKLNNNELVLFGNSYGYDNDFDKSTFIQGGWFLKVKSCEELPNPTYINQGDQVRLVAAGCPGAIVWNTGSTNLEINVSPSINTTYTVSCASNNNCTTYQSYQVNVNCSSNFTVSAQGNNLNPVVCNTSPSVILEATGCSGNILWSGGATTTSITISPTATGTYSATCSGTSCAAVTKTIQVTYIAAPTISTNSPTTVCIGTIINLTATTNVTGGTLQWYLDGNSIAGANALTYAATTTGGYSFKVTKDGCEAISNTFNVTVNTTIPPKPTLTASKLFVCGGGYPTNLTVNGCNGTVNWYTSNTSMLYWENGSAIGTTATAYIYGKVKIYVACTENLCTSPVSDTLSLDYTKVTVTALDNIICTGGSLDLNTNIYPSSGIGIVSYQWLKNGQNIPDATNSFYTATTAATYAVNVTFDNGCTTYSSGNPTIQSYGTLPNPTFSVTNNQTPGTLVKIRDKRLGSYSSDYFSSMYKNSNGLVLGGNVSGSKGGDLSTNTRGSSDYWVIRIDSNNNKLWDKSFGTYQYENLTTLIPTNNKSTLVIGSSSGDIDLEGGKSAANKGTLGYINGNYPSDFWVVKLDSMGNKVWDKTYGGSSDEYANAGIVENDGSFLIGGNTNSYTNGDISEYYRGANDFWLIKVDEFGNKIWDKRFGGSEDDGIISILKTPTGYLLGGSSNSPISGDKTQNAIGQTDNWIIKINNDGTKIWDKTFGTVDSDNLKTIIHGNDDGYICLSGYVAQKSILYKIDENGNKVWEKEIIDNTYYSPSQLISNSFGYIVIGSASVNNKGLEYSVIQFDNQGNKVWEKRLGGIQTEFAKQAIVENNKLFIGGYSSSPVGFDKTQPTRGTNDTDIWIVETNLNQEIPQPASVNSGQSINLIANNCPGTVTWSGGTSATGAMVSVSPTVPTTYTATCNAYGCSTSSNILININCSSNFIANAKDGNGVTITNPTVCTESPNVNLEATGCLGTISWSNGSTESAITVSPTSNTTYTATCSDAGCTSVTSSVQVKTFEIPTITSNGPTTVCVGNTVQLNAVIAGTGYSYQWSKDGIPYTAPNQTSSFTATVTGSYQVTVSKNGCSAISTAFVVNINTTIPPAPTFASDSVRACFGTNIQLTANGCNNGLVTWSNGSTGSSISYPFVFNGSASTIYLTATCQMNGCTSPPSSNLTVVPASSNILNNSTEYICGGSSVTLVGKAQNGATYQWESSTTINTTLPILQTNTAGSYYLRTIYYPNCSAESFPVLVENTTILPISTAMTTSSKDTLFKVWDKIYGGTSSDYPSQIIKTNDGNYLILGTSSSFTGGNKKSAQRGSDDFWLVKITPDGNVIWDKSYGANNSEYASKILKTNDNGYLLIGRTGSGINGDKTEPSIGGWDIWVIKIDENGNKIWDKTIGTIINDEIRDAILLADGTFVLVGESRSLDGNNADYQIFKISSTGSTIWRKIYTGDAYDSPYSIVQTNDNGFLINGYTNSGIANDKTAASKGGYDYWLLKIDTNGDKLWDKTFGGSGTDIGKSLQKTSDNYFYLTGSSSSNLSGDKSENSKGNEDYWIIKIDENGNKIWDKTLGGTLTDNFHTAIITTNNGVILGGWGYSGKSGDITENQNGNSYDIWLVKLNESGNKVWNKRIGGLGSDSPREFFIENDNLFVLGDSESNISGDKTIPSWNNGNCQNNFSCTSDIWLLKYLLKNPQPTPATANEGQSISLVASNCQGSVTWSNGMSGAIINVSPTTNTNYIATCSAFGCSTTSSIQINTNPCGQIVSLTQTENITTGTSQAPTTIKAQDSINATNTIGQPPTNASAKYAAGKSISLDPGFKVEIGSIFQAKISATPCNE